MSLELVSRADHVQTFRGCPVCYVQYVYNGHHYQTGPEDVRKETLSDYTGSVQLLIRNPCNVFTHLPLNWKVLQRRVLVRRGWSLERMLVYVWINMLTRWIISVSVAMHCFLFMNGSCNTRVNLYLTAQKKNAFKWPHGPWWPLWPCLNGSDEESTPLWFHAWSWCVLWVLVFSCNFSAGEDERLSHRTVGSSLPFPRSGKRKILSNTVALQETSNCSTVGDIQYNTIDYTCRSHDLWQR